MKKQIFATQEDCFVRISTDVSLAEAVYEHKEESDLMLFVFEENKSNEDFVAFYKDYYKHLSFEVIMQEAEESVRSSFEEQVLRLLAEDNSFVKVA